MRAEIAIEHMKAEFWKAQSAFPPFHSNHEGYAVILEELDELWEAIKTNPYGPFSSSSEIESEAIQVAAMALRFLVDRC